MKAIRIRQGVSEGDEEVSPLSGPGAQDSPNQ